MAFLYLKYVCIVCRRSYYLAGRFAKIKLVFAYKFVRFLWITQRILIKNKKIHGNCIAYHAFLIGIKYLLTFSFAGDTLCWHMFCEKFVKLKVRSKKSNHLRFFQSLSTFHFDCHLYRVTRCSRRIICVFFSFTLISFVSCIHSA